MKKNLLLLVLPFVLISLSTTAQERTDAYEICKWDKLSGILKAAKGWAYNENRGEWVEHYNYISTTNYGKEDETNYKYTASFNDYNFNTLQFETVTIDDKLYYCLFREINYGSYKYPALKEQWENSEGIGYDFFTPEEFNKFLDIKEETVKIPTTDLDVKIVTIGKSGIKFTRKNNIEKEAPKSKSKSKARAKAEAEVEALFAKPQRYFYLKKYKDVVRFLTPIIDSRGIDFEKHYFEVPIEEFKKLTTFD